MKNTILLFNCYLIQSPFLSSNYLNIINYNKKKIEMEVISPTITIKIVGNQWYWSIEYSDYTINNEDSIDFDSYLIPETDLELGQFRLLDVDNRITIPVNCHIRIIVTASDVLHSFAVPSLGIKIDACPGLISISNFNFYNSNADSILYKY
jgi:Heme/copper-type cytochrome/quinol oxidases, subunit 2